MKQNKTFCIHYTNEKDGVKIFEGSEVIGELSMYKGYHVLFSGTINNLDEIKKRYSISSDEYTQIIIDLYLKEGDNISNLISGYFSLIIINKNKIFVTRDGFGFENIYYFRQPHENRFIITNSVKEYNKFFNLKVNTEILPKYFLSTDLNGKETLFDGIFTLGIFEHLVIDLLTKEWSFSNYDSFLYDKIIAENLSDKSIISQIDNLLRASVKSIIANNEDATIITALSGGTDSSYLQCITNEFSRNKAYTANFKNYGSDGDYATDIAQYLKLDHKIIETDNYNLFKSIVEGIKICEKPFLFSGEALLNNMYEGISNNEKTENKIICYDGNGSEGILGFSRLLMETRLIKKYYLFAILFVYTIVRWIDKRSFKRYSEIITSIKTNKIKKGFFLRMFSNENYNAIIRNAFNLDSIDVFSKYEDEQLRKYNVSFPEKIYRLLAFEVEFRRVNNVRFQFAKKANINLVFPFTDLSFYKFFINISYEKKLKRKTSKYLFKKNLKKYLPKEFIYRKKIWKGIPIHSILNKEIYFQELIQEIKAAEYSYFNFDLDKVFAEEKYTPIALKLINFHIWHKYFIENIED
jgi:asparagine synthase (glutamine-hydrolysing)